MSSSNKRVSRPIKREADDDSVEESLGGEEEELKHSRRSPQKVSLLAASRPVRIYTFITTLANSIPT